MTQKEVKLAFDLISKTESHEEWLSVVRFGLDALVRNPPVLVEIIYREAKRGAERSKQDDIGQRIANILSELGLQMTQEEE